ncbi:isoprenylcysteine carboxylmethyltransferase family protein [Nocardioides sp. TRM66260-LWL]|uniref:methyltransferase family protein n=1 Tax=Nocardioides sp. TRM66260-LWL TaxID=2874478 RepID=UPI001CC40363|nr:isoprenylcysteine carboxylmethyltransferase family protein [Nocardioides sp. TRM66260-LWL]MBZ5733526.1 isoprenylcysteine carboxylmethyltransferase family protein [Nocardioides sp. TRM66260-LWL]
MSILSPYGALSLFAVYLVVGFGIRTWLQVRRTGDSGFRGLSGRTGSAEWWAGILFGAALLLGALGPVAGILGLADLAALDHDFLAAGGMALALLAIGGTLLTQMAMGDSWRVGVDEGERTELVMSGPFRVVRNPIFTAMVATGAGLVLVVPNIVAVVGWLLLVFAIELQVRVVEEPYLRRQHDENYPAYCARVGRFVPGLGLVER